MTSHRYLKKKPDNLTITGAGSFDGLNQQRKRSAGDVTVPTPPTAPIIGKVHWLQALQSLYGQFCARRTIIIHKVSVAEYTPFSCFMMECCSGIMWDVTLTCHCEQVAVDLLFAAKQHVDWKLL